MDLPESRSPAKSRGLRWVLFTVFGLIIALPAACWWVWMEKPTRRIAQLDALPTALVREISRGPEWFSDSIRERMPTITSFQVDELGKIKLPSLAGFPKLESVAIYANRSQVLDLRGCRELNDIYGEVGEAHFEGCRSVTWLYLDGTDLDASTGWEDLEQLESLELVECRWRTFPDVASFPKLDELYLLNTSGPVPWKQLDGLSKLTLSEYPADSVDWSSISSISKVALEQMRPGTIDLSKQKGLSDISIMEPPGAEAKILFPKHLRRIYLRQGPDSEWKTEIGMTGTCDVVELSGGTFRTLPEGILAGGKEFVVSECTMDQDLWDELATRAQIDKLRIGQGVAITAEAWAAIASMPSLRHLQIYAQSESLPPLDGFPALERLSIPEKSMPKLVRAPSLQRITYRTESDEVRWREVTGHKDGVPILGEPQG